MGREIRKYVNWQNANGRAKRNKSAERYTHTEAFEVYVRLHFTGTHSLNYNIYHLYSIRLYIRTVRILTQGTVTDNLALGKLNNPYMYI